MLAWLMGIDYSICIAFVHFGLKIQAWPLFFLAKTQWPTLRVLTHPQDCCELAGHHDQDLEDLFHEFGKKLEAARKTYLQKKCDTKFGSVELNLGVKHICCDSEAVFHEV